MSGPTGLLPKTHRQPRGVQHYRHISAKSHRVLWDYIIQTRSFTNSTVMEESRYLIFKSPIGNILIEERNKFITAISFIDQDREIRQSSAPLLKICANQLQEYFTGKRKKFSIPFEQQGTDFQQQVWSEVGKIPFGNLRSYEKVAIKIKNKKIVRAVGNAVGRNKLAIIIPCHRVIGKNGAMTGYAGGLWRKQWLIEHEQYYLLNLNQ